MMSTLVIVLRAIAFLAFAAPASFLHGHHQTAVMPRSRYALGRIAVAANLMAAGAFFPTLLYFSGDSDSAIALLLAITGCFVALMGVALVAVSRRALCAAWSFIPKAETNTGLVTSGPYRFVRHPIYLGLIVIAVGQVIAFGSWPAALIVTFGLTPTFTWRAVLEERLLYKAFDTRYSDYRANTKLIIPYLL